MLREKPRAGLCAQDALRKMENNLEMIIIPKGQNPGLGTGEQRPSCVLRGRSLATEWKRNCFTTVRSAWGRERKTGALFKHCQRDFYILEGEALIQIRALLSKPGPLRTPPGQQVSSRFLQRDELPPTSLSHGLFPGRKRKAAARHILLFLLRKGKASLWAT